LGGVGLFFVPLSANPASLQASSWRRRKFSFWISLESVRRRSQVRAWEDFDVTVLGGFGFARGDGDDPLFKAHFIPGQADGFFGPDAGKRPAPEAKPANTG
jgi:hypothetical protein